MEDWGSKIVRYCVTSFMDDPLPKSRLSASPIKKIPNYLIDVTKLKKFAFNCILHSYDLSSCFWHWYQLSQVLRQIWQIFIAIIETIQKVIWGTPKEVYQSVTNCHTGEVVAKMSHYFLRFSCFLEEKSFSKAFKSFLDFSILKIVRGEVEVSHWWGVSQRDLKQVFFECFLAKNWESDFWSINCQTYCCLSNKMQHVYEVHLCHMRQ